MSQLTREVITDDEYDDKMKNLRTERARLKTLPAEPDRIEEVPTGQTRTEYLADLDAVGKRQWMISHGVKVCAHRHTDGELIVAVEGPDELEAEGRWEGYQRTLQELPEMVKSIQSQETA
jgi:hypothetical protein